MSKPKKWQIQSISAKTTMEVTAEFSSVGADGWELVSVLQNSDGAYVGFLKRELPKKKRKLMVRR